MNDSLLFVCGFSLVVGDSIDSAIISLGLIATMSGKDLWTYVQKEPHLFSVGGLFYKQVERDLGLTPNKHCTLPALPGKVSHTELHLVLLWEAQCFLGKLLEFPAMRYN